MTTADDYVNTVLGMMPPTMPQRTQIADELRSHIAERLAHGHSIDEVLKQLGNPATLADSYLSAEPLVSAPFSSRAIAKLLDGLAVLAVVCPLAWVVTRLVPSGFGPPIAVLLVMVGGSLLFGVYTVIAEYRRGQTIGKRLQGIRVVSETGARVSLVQAIVRQLSMFLQVYWIDVMFALFTDKSQRAFEMLSKTRVVRA
ncbi:MAG TPA: RDD family protein [Vicinamibacterales bacterium]|nr:RDD family protein [Vicinamibacterales bacterium]